MECVNINNAEFKQLAKANNVDSNTLELIIHQYYLDTGSSEIYPSSVYIQSKLGMRKYKEPSSIIRKMWKTRYRVPQEYDTMKEIEDVIEQAKRYFPQNEIHYHKTADGKYMFSVNEPVEKVDYTIDEFFDGVTEEKNPIKDLLREGYYANKWPFHYMSGKEIKALLKDYIGLRVNNIDRINRLNKLVDDLSDQEVVALLQPYEQEVSDFRRVTGSSDVQYSINRALSASEYSGLIEELGLSEQKTSEFVTNFMAKIVNANPRRKVDTSGNDYTRRQLSEKRPNISGEESFYKLCKKIFGFSPFIRIDQNREDFEEQVDAVLSSWENKLINRINDPKVKVSYREKSNILTKIKLLQNALHKGLDYSNLTEEEIKAVDEVSLGRRRITKKDVGYKIQQLKKDLKDVNKEIQRQNYARYAIILGAKNRFTALGTIPNLKDLVKERLLAEYDSRILSDAEYNEQIEPFRNLEEAIQKAVKSSERETEGIFKEPEQKEITFNDFYNEIVNTYPQYKEFIELCHKANPNLKIVVGGEPEESAFGKVTGKFHPLTNTLYLSSIADIFTAIHELAHSATYYGMSRKDKNDSNSKAFKAQIERFMDYIRDYIDKSKMDPSTFKPTRIMGVGMPATIYGFTNPSEFIAELFSNPSFQELLDNIPAMEEKEFKSLLHEIWDAIINFLRNIAGINQDITALEQARKLGYACMMLQQQHINDVYEQLKEIAERGNKDDNVQRSVLRNTPSVHTFNDGSTVETPFKLNDEQEKALNAMYDFVTKDTSDTGRVMTLNGYAGTGKTTITKILAKRLKNVKPHKTVHFTASTNKAAQVLGEGMSRIGYVAQTFHSLFGFQVVPDNTKTQYNAKRLKLKLGEVRAAENSVVFIDEASMINDECYDEIKKIAKNYNLKIIFIGDAAQLNPIHGDGKERPSKVFLQENGTVVTLTKVERTGENKILDEATRLRNGDPVTKESQFNNGEGVGYIERSHKNKISEIIRTFIPKIKKNLNAFKILTFKRETADIYNDFVRKSLGYDVATPRVGEPMVAYINWGRHYNSRTKTATYDLINADNYIIEEVSEEREKTVTLTHPSGAVEMVPIKYRSIVLRNTEGELKAFDYVDVRNNSVNKENAMKIARVKQDYHELAVKTGQFQYYNERDRLERTLLINADLDVRTINEYGKEEIVTLQNKALYFGYAMTIHKSQGSTFENVLVDETDLPDRPVREESLFDDVPATVSATSLSKYQRLMYVGVSRASQTATVITDNVVREESPIEHLNDSSNTGTPSQSQEEETMNIYAGTGENADLSNFAERPFTLWDRPFASVEQGYHIVKFSMLMGALSNEYKTKDKDYDAVIKQINSLIQQLYKTKRGGELKSIGGTRIQTNNPQLRAIINKFFSTWKAGKEASSYMKELIKASFKQNEKALKRLLDTGDTKLTHTQGTDGWDTEFPKLLMEVREELRKEVKEVAETNEGLKTSLGGGSNADSEIKDTVKEAKKGLSFDEVLAGQEPFFTKEEQDKIKQALRGKSLYVMSVDRRTDIAFYAKEFIDFLKENAKKDLSDPTRITAVEIWSKHDGLPMKEILDACKKYRVAPMVSFSITGLGDTAMEKGVMKYQDMLERVGRLIKNGTLNPATTTIRIDPIMPGITNMDDVRKIVQIAKSFGLKKFVSSIMQSYGYLDNAITVWNPSTGKTDRFYMDNKASLNLLKARFPQLDIQGVGKNEDGSLYLVNSKGEKIEDKYENKSNKFEYADRRVTSGVNSGLSKDGKSYDWDKYYGRDRYGKVIHTAKPEYVAEIGKVLLEIANDPEITYQTCAFKIEGMNASACLDPLIIERITGISVTRPDGTYERDTSRPYCMCFSCHGNFFKTRKRCMSACLYCYAAHSGDSKFDYYNEDGTLKDSIYTRTEETDTQDAQEQTANEDVWNAAAAIKTPTERRKIRYTPVGKTEQIYEINGTHIINKNGDEIFSEDNKDRRKIFANDAVNTGRAVVVTVKIGSKEEKFVVNNKKKILSVASGNFVYDNPNDGNRKKILVAAADAFRKKLASQAQGTQDGSQKEQQPTTQLNVQAKDSRYTPKAESGLDAFAKAGAALRSTGWHIEYYSKKSKDGSRTMEVMTISMEGQPEKGFFELVKDVEANNYSVHFKTKDAKSNNETKYASVPVSDAEKNAMFAAIAYAVPRGGRVSTWGTLSPGGVAGLERFKNLGFFKTGERNVKTKNGEDITIPIFTKNSQSVIMQQLLGQITEKNDVPIHFLDEMLEFLEKNGQDAERIQQAIEEKKEMEEIKAEAIANGTFMLAPNGKKSNLTERQWLQVRTKAFKKWFGDWERDPANASKVVDENGEPLVVYHGSKKTWTIYDKNVFKRDQFGRGIYLTEEYDNAENYGNIRAFFVNAKNPFYAGYIYDANKKKTNRVKAAGLLFNHESIDKDDYVEELKQYIDDEGEATAIGTELSTSDAVVISYRARSNTPRYKYGEIVVSSPNQIKSATDNIGTFLESNNDIQMMMVGEEGSGTSSEVAFAKTPEGEVYGFIDPETGDMYLDETIISLEHPIHEYTHLWDNAVYQRNRGLWNRGIVLMKEFKIDGRSIWEEVENDSNYGVKWKNKGITDERLEFLIGSEVHARLVGKYGERFLEERAKEQGEQDLFNKMKEWLLQMWKEIVRLNTFGEWKGSQLDALTLEDFNKLTVKDLIMGTNLKAQNNQTINTNPPAGPSAPSGNGNILTGSERPGVPKYYEGNVAPDVDTVFVFGSNPEGRHGAGAAKVAVDNFNATYGVGEGLQGSAYALPTKDLNKAKGKWWRPGKKEEDAVKEWYANENRDYSDVLDHPLNGERSMTPQEIIRNIQKFYEVARQNPDKQFKVVHYPLGKISLNGYIGEEMREMFIKAGEIPDNVIFHKEWADSWPVQGSAESNIAPDVTGNEEGEENNTYPMVLTETNFTKLTGEEVVLDAEWKKSYFEGFDSEIDINDAYVSSEAIKDIIRLLDAEDEESYNDPSLRTEEQVRREEAKSYGRLTQQVRNLYDNNLGIDIVELNYIAETVVNGISDNITSIQEGGAEQVKKWFGIELDLDYTKATRKQIVDAIGLDNFIALAKELFSLALSEGVNPYLANNNELIEEGPLKGILKVDAQVSLICNNWDAIMFFAMDLFAKNEGFGMRRDYVNNTFKTTADSNIDPGSLNEHNDEESIAETQGDPQEQWQLVLRTISVMDSMTELVRRGIHKCYMLNEDGSIKMSRWGYDIPERVGTAKAVKSILRWTKGARTIEEMIEKLEERQKAPSNRWLSQLIDRLKKNDGTESDFQSQFFNVMCQSFQVYSVGRTEEDGNYSIMEVNRNPALTATMESIVGTYKAGLHPLFTLTSGINGKYLEKLNSILTELNGENGIIKEVNTALKNKKDLDEAIVKKAAANISAASKILGYDMSEKSLLDLNLLSPSVILEMIYALGYLVENLNKTKGDNVQTYNPFAFTAEKNGGVPIGTELRKFLRPVIGELEDTTIDSFFENGNMYQSWVIPSFLTLLTEEFSKDASSIKKFMAENYGFSQFFAEKSGERLHWRNEAMRLLANDADTQAIFSHRVELLFDGDDYMRKLSPEKYLISVISEYCSEPFDKSGNRTPVWYRVPIMSNKPSAEYLRFWAYVGMNYKSSITSRLYEIALQEISRIQTVRKRNEEGVAKIQLFDDNGKNFCFLPFLNAYLDGNMGTIFKDGENAVEGTSALDEEENSKDAVLAKLLKDKIDGIALTPEQEVKLRDLLTEALFINTTMTANTQLDEWERNGIMEAASKIKGIKNFGISTREALENFLWNDQLASKNILMLTVGDIACYKDAVRLQKRLGQIHAPGQRANIYARDYEGNRVSDGIHRTMVLNDFEYVAHNLIDNLTEALDRKIERAHKAGNAVEEEALKVLKERLVGKDGVYRKINVTDAQAFNSPTSYRKKALMFGKWSKEFEKIYERLMNNDFTLTDLEVAFQPLKPFVYGLLHEDMEVAGAPITQMPIPFQAKNAEYLLIMADALIADEKLSRPNLLRAIYRVMEDSAYDGRTYNEDGTIKEYGTYNRRGIDTVQFDSAIKCGGQTFIDISPYRNMSGGENAAYTYMMNMIYTHQEVESDVYNVETETVEKKKVRQITDKYNKNVVKSLPYQCYCIQQEVPPHFKNHKQPLGSQARMIIPADLDYYYDEAGDKNDPANIVKYGRKGIPYVKEEMTAKEIRQEWEDTAKEGIDLSFEELDEMLHFSSDSKKDKNFALSKILRNRIGGSSRYDMDMFMSCTVDTEDPNWDFLIPKGDPVQSKMIEQLIFSIIKNNVNKQEIAGGPIVQVSNFGVSKQLHIRWQDKDGNTLPTRDEFFNAYVKKHKLPMDTEENQKQTYETTKAAWNAFLKENQASIAHFEVFLPLWAKDIFDKFADKDGNIDVGALEMVCPELLEMISYRIPTEYKYSIAHMKCAGFMPAWAGDACMFPYELTEIDDSDFDVDKRYVIRKEFYIYTRFEPKENESMTDAEKSYIRHNKKELIKYLRVETGLPEGLTPADKSKLKSLRASLKSLQKKKKEIEDTTEGPLAEGLARENRIREINNKIGILSAKIDDIARRDKIQQFLESGRWMNSSTDDKATRRIRKAYLNYMFKVVKPDRGMDARAYINNKLFDLAWAILSNETSVDKMLNPGGFEAIKNIAFKIAAYKLNNGRISWEELGALPTDALQKMSEKAQDLTWIGTQIDFYRQNSAAAGLIGIAAVESIAHATLQGDEIYLDINEVCGKGPIEIGNVRMNGRVLIDPRSDTRGTLVSKSLGSNVSASADAAKTPAFHNINVNMGTMKAFTTAERLGMPLEIVAMLFGQDVVSRVMDKFNIQNLNGYASLDNIIEEELATIERRYKLSPTSLINQEAISEEELMRGLLPRKEEEILSNYEGYEKEEDDKTKLAAIPEKVRQRDAMEYKTLLAFKKLLMLAEDMRMPTLVTRLNSVSSAVGPLHIDNLMREYKFDQFTRAFNDEGIAFYDAKGNKIDMNYILEKHPILKGFYRTYEVADRMVSDMPVGHAQFKELLLRLPGNLREKVMTDKNLLSSLSNYYQTYLAVAGKLVLPEEANSYIWYFPTSFKRRGYEKNPDGTWRGPYANKAFRDKVANNPLMKKIQIGKADGKHPHLYIDITGMEDDEKRLLKSAWADLHKLDPMLSTQLFFYNMFRGGLAFNPKTFISLAPEYVRERIVRDYKGDPTRYYYKEMLRRIPAVNPNTVIDLWVRHNSSKYKLVPYKSWKRFNFGSTKEGYLIVSSKKDKEELANTPYFKTVTRGATTIWRYSHTTTKGDFIYKPVKELGNYGEKLEFMEPQGGQQVSDGASKFEDQEEYSPSIDDDAATVDRRRFQNKATEKAFDKLVDALIRFSSFKGKEITKEDAGKIIEEAKNTLFNGEDSEIAKQRKWIREMLVHEGVNVDEAKAEEWFNNMC